MRPALNAVAARNGGVFLRREAVRAGYSEREMKTVSYTHLTLPTICSV